MTKFKPSTIGLLQALGVTVYCVLISGMFWFLGKNFPAPSQFMGMATMLLLFVFSATVTGSIVFGYSVYLAVNKKTKEALLIFAYTLLYFIGIIFILMILIFMLT